MDKGCLVTEKFPTQLQLKSDTKRASKLTSQKISDIRKREMHFKDFSETLCFTMLIFSTCNLVTNYSSLEEQRTTKHLSTLLMCSVFAAQSVYKSCIFHYNSLMSAVMHFPIITLVPLILIEFAEKCSLEEMCSHYPCNSISTIIIEHNNAYILSCEKHYIQRSM